MSPTLTTYPKMTRPIPGGTSRGPPGRDPEPGPGVKWARTLRHALEVDEGTDGRAGQGPGGRTGLKRHDGNRPIQRRGDHRQGGPGSAQGLPGLVAHQRPRISARGISALGSSPDASSPKASTTATVDDPSRPGSWTGRQGASIRTRICAYMRAGRTRICAQGLDRGRPGRGQGASYWVPQGRSGKGSGGAVPPARRRRRCSTGLRSPSPGLPHFLRSKPRSFLRNLGPDRRGHVGVDTDEGDGAVDESELNVPTRRQPSL